MQRRHRARRYAQKFGTTLAAATVLFAASSCSILEGSRHQSSSTPYEIGATEFQAGDGLTIDRLQLEGETFEPGATIHIEGRYELGSREAATLYLGTTAIGAREASFEEDEANRVSVASGSGTFALSHRIPARGYPHLTFYDARTGAPFGGIYFGRGESLLRERDWSYDH